MDVDKKRRNRPIEKRQLPEPTDSSFSLTTIPLYLLSKCFDIVKPLAPHFIPLLVFSVLVPLVFLISAGAGYAVWINAATGWEAPLYLQYGDGTSPYASVSLPTLVTQQPYDISLHLNVPATQGNLELGNFMTSLRLASNSNQTLAAIRRPAIVMPYRSSLFASRQVVIDIPMLSSYAPTTSNLHATVSLGRQDNWKTIGAGEGRELAVYEASLRGVVVHKGIQGLVTRFPLLASTAASTIFLVVLFSLVALCVLPVMLPPRTLLQSEIDGDTSSDPAEHEVKKEEESARRRRRVARGNRSTSNRRPFKQESEEETVLPEAETSSPLRRRRSRMSESES